MQQFEPGNQSELSLIQLPVFRQQSIAKFCCNGESRKPLHFWLNVSGSSRHRLARSGARAILKFWLRATAFVNLRQKCPKWQNWATLSCDMHLGSGLLRIDFKSGFQKNCMHLKLWQNTVISPWACRANQQPSPNFLMIFPHNQHSTGQNPSRYLLAVLCKMLQPISAAESSVNMGPGNGSGRAWVPDACQHFQEVQRWTVRDEDYRQSQWSLSSSLSSSDPSPVKPFIGGEIFILKREIIAHADFLSLIPSASNEKMEKIAKISEWYPRLSLMSWMRDNRILTVNQQEPISSDLLVRGQPFPSKNLVNATRLGHSWLTPRLAEDIYTFQCFWSPWAEWHHWLGPAAVTFWSPKECYHRWSWIMQI